MLGDCPISPIIWKIRRMMWDMVPAAWLTPWSKCVPIPWGSPAELRSAIAANTFLAGGARRLPCSFNPSLVRTETAEVTTVFYTKIPLPTALYFCYCHSQGYWWLDVTLLEVTSDRCFPLLQNQASALQSLSWEVSKEWSWGLQRIERTISINLCQTLTCVDLAGDLERGQDPVILSWVGNWLSE